MATGRKGSLAEVVRWFAVVALLALPLAQCSDAGDSPAAPDSGEGGTPITAGLSARGEDTAAGGSMTITGHLYDANGQPVQGAKILCSCESASVSRAPYFTFETNPTTTAANGGFSVNVNVSSTTPSGSYTIVVQTSSDYSGPYAKTYVGFTVTGTGGETITRPDAPIGNTVPQLDTPTTYRAQGAVSSLGHTVEYQFDWGDGSANSEWITADSSGEALGTHTFNWVCGDNVILVTVKARCKADPTVVSRTSEPLTVSFTVSGGTCP